jgi:uncharacterized Zn finger protein
MTVRVEWESDTARMERCDHEGTTEPMDGSEAIVHCTECGRTWPAKFGAGAATVRVVAKT